MGLALLCATPTPPSIQLRTSIAKTGIAASPLIDRLHSTPRGFLGHLRAIFFFLRVSIAQTVDMTLLLPLVLALTAVAGSVQAATTPAAARTLPPYVRGKNKYEWMLTELERDRGISYYGAADRLRAKMDALLTGALIARTLQLPCLLPRHTEL